MGAGLACVLAASVSRGQPAAQQEQVTLRLTDDVELKFLLDYVSERLSLNVIYDEQVAGQRVTIRAPQAVPVDSLLGLLRSAMAMKGMVLIEAEQPGWLRVVKVSELSAVSTPTEAGAAGPAQAGLAVTRVFRLSHAQATQVDQIIKPFLTQPGANSVAVSEHRMLIVTDYAANMRRVEQLVNLTDRPGEEVTTRFIAAEHLPAEELGQRLTEVLTARRRAAGMPGGDTARGIETLPVDRTNQLVLIGSQTQLDEAMETVHSLDVPLGLETRVYTFQSVGAERIDRLVRELVGELAVDRLYRSTVDADANLLAVTATPEYHGQVERLKEQLDQPYTESQSPMRIYKLENSTALEVLTVIRELEAGAGYVLPTAGEGARGNGSGAPFGVSRDGGYSGANRPPGAAGLPPPLPPSSVYRPSEGSAASNTHYPGEAVEGANVVRSSRVWITADPATNSLIVVAPPETQAVYEKIIRQMDRRRPQVLLEMTIVTIDTSNGFSLGVEIAAQGSVNATDLIAFSAFGLSMPDADTGRLSPIPGVGFNGAVISTDVADVIIRALKTNARARVVSSPRILVADNAEGRLDSVNEAPFTSVNASDTVATTSFGGFVEAGTTITVTPHISEGDHLQLEYTIALNSFSGDATQLEGGGLAPPPRQTNSLQSRVTIPDGATMIVGGLTRSDSNESVSAIPLLGEIPWIEHLFSSRTINESQTTLFAFIRPVILRDDEFADLRYYSQRDANRAQIQGDFPPSEPLTTR